VSYRVRYTRTAREDLHRLYSFLLKRDLAAARRGREAIAKSILFRADFPFTCRKAAVDTPFLRELLIPFGAVGYVALLETDDHETATTLAFRHHREENYH
jgi:plasmid stabilization system protein ParE